MKHAAPELPKPSLLEKAARRLRGLVHRTPILSSRTLSERTGAEVLLKCENLQRAGSFKIRGALNASLVASQRGEIGDAGILTYSSGNHGQAVALAGRILGCAATVVVPESIPRVKREAIESYGGHCVVCGLTSQDRRARAEKISREQGAVIIPPFDHRLVIAGQSTVGREILEDAPRADVILVPVGGGGLLAGVALAAASRKNGGPRVIGVEPVSANAMQLSLDAGRRVTLPGAPQTIADGLCPITPGEVTFEAARRHVETVLLVEDDPMREAQRLILERAKLLVEPSGAAAVAALVVHRHLFAGRTVVAILSGGNTEVTL